MEQDELELLHDRGKKHGANEQPWVAGNKHHSETSTGKMFINSLNTSHIHRELEDPSLRKIHLQYKAVHWVDNTGHVFICPGIKMELHSSKRG